MTLNHSSPQEARMDYIYIFLSVLHIYNNIMMQRLNAYCQTVCGVSDKLPARATRTSIRDVKALAAQLHTESADCTEVASEFAYITVCFSHEHVYAKRTVWINCPLAHAQHIWTMLLLAGE